MQPIIHRCLRPTGLGWDSAAWLIGRREGEGGSDERGIALGSCDIGGKRSAHMGLGAGKPRLAAGSVSAPGVGEGDKGQRYNNEDLCNRPHRGIELTKANSMVMLDFAKEPQM